MRERTKLLPKWIYLFSWLFLVFLGSPAFFIVGYHMGYSTFSMYGIRYEGDVFHPISLALITLGTIHGVVAYGLLWGKRWGVDAGIILCAIAISCSLSSIIYWSLKGNFYFDLSFIFLLIFLIGLVSIRKTWTDLID